MDAKCLVQWFTPMTHLPGLVSLHCRPLAWLPSTEHVFHPQDHPTAGPGAKGLPQGHVVLSASLGTPNWVLRKWISLVSVRNAVPRVTPKQRAPTAMCASRASQPHSQQRKTCGKKAPSLPGPPVISPSFGASQGEWRLYYSSFESGKGATAMDQGLLCSHRYRCSVISIARCWPED